MNKAEKTLANKVLAFYNSPSKNSSFTREENNILERWRAHNIINEDAFSDATPLSSKHKEYRQTRNFPFTSSGSEEIKKNWYLHFRETTGIIIVRDIFTIIAFLISVCLGISEFIKIWVK
jgi:hypothetical protein